MLDFQNNQQILSSTVDVQVISASGSWVKPTGVRANSVTRIVVISGGSGGGSGRKGAAGTIRSGGGGGSQGGRAELILPTSLLGPTESVVIGNGGAGAPIVGSNSTSGTNGLVGGFTAFGTWLVARPGGAGAAGNTGAAAGGSAPTYFPTATSGAGAGSAPTGTAGLSSAAGVFYGGGGSGGGITTANASSAGGQGAGIGTSTSGYLKAGTVNTAAGANGVDAEVASGMLGMPGGGGASSTSGNASPGGNGGFPGGGGGGGGAAVDSVGNSGAGGSGANGICVVYTWL